MEFIKRSNAVSPGIAMETATALQVLSFVLWFFNKLLTHYNASLSSGFLNADEIRKGDS